MLDFGKDLVSAPISLGGAEITTGTLLQTLADHAQKPLIFSYEGRDVLPGYHVTEVKDGQFHALDCGANPESWRETFIQIWDVPSEDGRSFMKAGLFNSIIRKVETVVAFDPEAKLTFEVSDGNQAIQLFRADAIHIAGEVVRVSLSRRPASCKPRDRWLEERTSGEACTTKAPCC